MAAMVMYSRAPYTMNKEVIQSQQTQRVVYKLHYNALRQWLLTTMPRGSAWLLTTMTRGSGYSRQCPEAVVTHKRSSNWYLVVVTVEFLQLLIHRELYSSVRGTQ